MQSCGLSLVEREDSQPRGDFTLVKVPPTGRREPASSGASHAQYRRRRRARARLDSPMSWPVGLRRLALLTFPIALPLWVGALVCRSLALLLRDCAAAIGYAWNQPPQRRRSDMFGRDFWAD